MFPSASRRGTLEVSGKQNSLFPLGPVIKCLLLYTLTFTQLNEHCDWLILGHVPLIKFKCIPIEIQLSSSCPRVARDQCMTKLKMT